MTNLVGIITSSVAQVILFAVVPLIWWFVKARNEASFFSWVGLKKPQITNRRSFEVLFGVTTLGFFALMLIVIPQLVAGEDMATSQFAGKGLSALVPALIYAFIQTGFSEELLFRGFLAKQLISCLGFNLGNFIQGLLFGILHGAMFMTSTGAFGALVITVLTGLIGWVMGYLNEKLAQGSIIPSWILHGISNSLSPLIVLF